jgi:6-phosphogluconolactonase
VTDGREIVVAASADALAEDTARRAVEALSAAIQQRGEAHLVVTGGSILEAVLSRLAGAQSLDWSAVQVWWGDERYVPADSDDRNDKPACAKLFDRVPVDPAKLHRMPAADAGFGDDAQAAADSYAAELAAAVGADPDTNAVPSFDVVLLGIGPDGHCCSLFPNHPGTQVLDASVIAVHESPKPPPTRLSLTFPALDEARELWFIASGEGKADAVAEALAEGAKPEEIPSSGPRGRERTLWLVDSDAAAKLPQRA